MAFKGGVVLGTVSLNATGSGTTAIGATTNTGTITIGNTSSGVVNINCGTAGINVGTSLVAHTSIFGSGTGASSTIIRAGSGAFNFLSVGGPINMNSGTGPISIGIDATNATYNIATGAGSKLVTIGSTTAGSTLTLSTPTSTQVVASNGLIATVGNLTASSGNLALPATTSSTIGSISLGGQRIVHAYGALVDGNTFCGTNSGNYTLTVGTAIFNTGIGRSSLRALTTGDSNTCIGASSGLAMTTGLANCSIGSNSLLSLTTGTRNTMIGNGAGLNLTLADSNNIFIGSGLGGTAGTSNRLWIGNASGTGNNQIDVASIAGITGRTSTAGVAVLVNASDVLGTTTSSRRFKQNIKNMATDSNDIYKLRPVTFNYKVSKPHVDEEGAALTQYGLIAEEVVDIMPNLVSYNKDGDIESVRYLNLIPMLLNEIQKLNKRIDQLEAK